MTLSLRDEKDFVKYIDRLGALRKNNIVPNNIKIGNYYRSKTTLCPLIYSHLKRIAPSGSAISRALVENIFEQNFGAWSAVIPVKGDKRYVALVHRQIKEAVGDIARIRTLDTRKLKWAKAVTLALRCIPFFRHQHAVLCAVEPLFDLSRGVPTDATLPSLYWPALDVPEDYTHPDIKPQVGMIAYLPMIPLDGAVMNRVQEQVVSIFESYGFIANITITMVSHKAMWGVIDMPFDRSDSDTLRRARQCIADVTRTLLPEGIIPQRVGIDSMPMVVEPEDAYWKYIAKLKSSFDPEGILSPGRYHP